jgi:hypothetical protein
MPRRHKTEPKVVRSGRDTWVVVKDFEPGWTARFKVLLVPTGLADGFPIVEEARIEPTPVVFPLRLTAGKEPSEWGLSSRIIRKVPISAVWTAKGLFPGHEYLKQLFSGRRVQRGKKRTGRPPLRDEELARIAEIYAKATRNPARAVADALGLDRSTARNRIFKARARGFLNRTAWGRPGGEATRKTEQVLRAQRRSRRKK